MYLKANIDDCALIINDFLPNELFKKINDEIPEYIKKKVG